MTDYARRFFPLVVESQAQRTVDGTDNFRLSLGDLRSLLESEDNDSKDSLKRLKMNVLRNDTSADTSDMINGYIVRLESRNLGLMKVE